MFLLVRLSEMKISAGQYMCLLSPWQQLTRGLFSLDIHDAKESDSVYVRMSGGCSRREELNNSNLSRFTSPTAISAHLPSDTWRK